MTTTIQVPYCQQATDYWIHRTDNTFELWIAVPLDKIVLKLWYDWVDKITGAFGQCKVLHFVGGHATQPVWHQSPLGWRHEVSGMSEQNLVAVYEYNQRYVILECLGQFTAKK